MSGDEDALQVLDSGRADGTAPVKEVLPKILLVDDDRLSRRLVSSLLVGCGYQGARLLSADGGTLARPVRASRALRAMLRDVITFPTQTTERCSLKDYRVDLLVTGMAVTLV